MSTKNTINKRNLFDELMDGLDSMQKERKGKITLRKHELRGLQQLQIDAEVISNIPEC